MSKVLKGEFVQFETPSEVRCPSVKVLARPEPSETKAEDDLAVLREAEERAQRLLKEAEEEASRLLSDAQRKAEGMFKAAYEEGLLQGREEGIHQALEREIKAVRDLEELCARLDRARSEALSGLEEEAVSFAFDLACRIVNTELDRNDQAFVNILREAAARLVEPSRVILKVGPREYAIASHHIGEIKKCIDGLQSLEIVLVEDRPGCARFETEAGAVDASIDTRIRRAGEILDIKERRA